MIFVHNFISLKRIGEIVIGVLDYLTIIIINSSMKIIHNEQ